MNVPVSSPVAVPNSQPTVPTDPRQLAAIVMGGFKGPLVRPTTSVGYQLGIVATTIVMLVLPLVYLAMIAGVGWLVWWHLANNHVMLHGARGRGAVVVFVAYLAPAVVGGLIALFMLKPFFAPRAKEGRTRSVTSDSDPLLYAFVHRIADLVGSSRPSRIDIDCDPNASASFRSGWWGFLTGQLVLTIGMPLVAGMTLRSLGGVIAHEFGHFSQGAGMRLTYVVRTINAWLVSAAYERDQWDDWLHESARELDFRFSWVLWLAIFAIWLSRKVLAGLAWVSHAVAGFMLRQMEFDADQYETRLAGSATFERTSRRLRSIGFAYSQAVDAAGGHREEGRLADNLPKMMAWSLERISPELQKRIDEHADQEQASWFDTHPSDSDRIRAALATNAAGVYDCELPATTLFRDFDETARGVTHDLYCEVLDTPVPLSSLHPADDLLAKQAELEAKEKAFDAFFLGVSTLWRRIAPVGEWSGDGPVDPQASVNAMHAAREAMRAQAADAQRAYEDWSKGRQAAIEARIASVFFGLDLSVRDTPLAETCPDSGTAMRRREWAEAQMSQANERLAPFEAAAARRWHAAVQALRSPVVAARVPDAANKWRHAQTLTSLLTRLGGCWHDRMQLMSQLTNVESLFDRLDESESVDAATFERLQSAIATACQIRQQFVGVDYPFDNDRQGLTVAEYLLPFNGPIEPSGEAFGACAELVERSFSLGQRAMAWLCDLTIEIESAVSLPAMPRAIPERE